MKITRTNKNAVVYQDFEMPKLITNGAEFESIVNSYVVNRQLLKTADSISATELRINTTVAKIEELDGEINEFMSTLADITNKQSDKKATKKALAELEKERAEIDKDLLVKTSARAELDKTIADLREKLSGLEKLFAELETLAKTLSTTSDEENTDGEIFKTYAKYFSLLWEKSYYTDEKGKKHQRFIKGFERLFTTCVDYVEKYAPSNQEWTQTRINDYNDIRNQVNTIGATISSDGNEDIKPYHFTIRNKDVHKLLTLATKYYSLGKKSVVEKVKSSARDEFHSQLLFILLWYTDTKSIDTSHEI